MRQDIVGPCCAMLCLSALPADLPVIASRAAQFRSASRKIIGACQARPARSSSPHRLICRNDVGAARDSARLPVVISQIRNLFILSVRGEFAAVFSARGRRFASNSNGSVAPPAARRLRRDCRPDPADRGENDA